MTSSQVIDGTVATEEAKIKVTFIYEYVDIKLTNRRESLKRMIKHWRMQDMLPHSVFWMYVFLCVCVPVCMCSCVYVFLCVLLRVFRLSGHCASG
jgi:hypothetical protein